MSWLITLFLAGVMFTSDASLPTENHLNYINSDAPRSSKQDETERFEQFYPLNPTGRISVSNVNGAVTVRAWDRSEVKLIAVKTADSRETLAEVEIKIDSRPDYLRVETDYQNWKQRNGRDGWRENRRLNVEYNLMVPRMAVLNEIETVNGSITVADMMNYTKVSAVNGQVRGTNLGGTANLSTVNGNTEAEFASLMPTSKISLSTVNGQATLLIPSDANATIKADTVNGSINNNFGLPVRKGEYVGRDLYGRIGSGETQIKLDSVNGGLTINRRNDGKSPNPAVNLLPPTRSGNTDENWERGAVINTNKLNKEIAEAVKKSHKESEKAHKEAEKELSKMKPQLAEVSSEAVKIAEDVIKETLTAVETEEARAQLRKAREDMRRERERLNEFIGFSAAPNIEKKSGTFGVNGTPKVTIEAKSCDVTIRGWEKPEVTYFISKISRNRNQEPIKFDVKLEGSNVNIIVEESEESEGLFTEISPVRVEVFVPKKSNLRILSEREVRLEGVTGEVELTGGEGSINVRDSGGRFLVSSDEGRIRVIGFRGALDARSDEGQISLEGIFEKLSARTVDGTIILTLPEDANAIIESNSKEIQTEGISLDFLGDGKSTSRWKVGKGGANHLLYTAADGQIFVRGTSYIAASF